MQIQDHWAKAMRLEATRTAKLHKHDDYELVIWTCIHGGAQLANVALHKLGVTEDSFDLIHSNIPELNRTLPVEAASMLATLKSIEDLGPRFVRGPERINSQDMEACLSAYSKVKTFAEKLMKG